jgi:hypothetical protein
MFLFLFLGNVPIFHALQFDITSAYLPLIFGNITSIQEMNPVTATNRCSGLTMLFWTEGTEIKYSTSMSTFPWTGPMRLLDVNPYLFAVDPAIHFPSRGSFLDLKVDPTSGIWILAMLLRGDGVSANLETRTYIYRYDENADSWQVPIFYRNVNGTSTSGISVSPDDNGSWLVTWTQYEAGNMRADVYASTALYSSSIDDGLTWQGGRVPFNASVFMTTTLINNKQWLVGGTVNGTFDLPSVKSNNQLSQHLLLLVLDNSTKLGKWYEPSNPTQEYTLSSIPTWFYSYDPTTLPGNTLSFSLQHFQGRTVVEMLDSTIISSYDYENWTPHVTPTSLSSSKSVIIYITTSTVTMWVRPIITQNKIILQWTKDIGSFNWFEYNLTLPFNLTVSVDAVLPFISMSYSVHNNSITLMLTSISPLFIVEIDILNVMDTTNYCLPPVFELSGITIEEYCGNASSCIIRNGIILSVNSTVITTDLRLQTGSVLKVIGVVVINGKLNTDISSTLTFVDTNSTLTVSGCVSISGEVVIKTFTESSQILMQYSCSDTISTKRIEAIATDGATGCFIYTTSQLSASLGVCSCDQNTENEESSVRIYIVIGIISFVAVLVIIVVFSLFRAWVFKFRKRMKESLPDRTVSSMHLDMMARNGEAGERVD